jgi:hypothetical protein
MVKKAALWSIPGMFIAVWSLPGFRLAAFLALLPELRSLRDVIALITTIEGVGWGRLRNEEGWLIRNKGGCLCLLDLNIMVPKSRINNKGCGFCIIFCYIFISS